MAYYNQEPFMKSKECWACSSTVTVVCDPYNEVQFWSEKTQQEKGNCLIEGFISSLPREVSLDLKQNDLTGLVNIWKQISKEKKEDFCSKYGQIASLISVVVEEPLLKAAIQFWDPSYRCFTFNEVDLMPTIEEYSILIGLDLKSPDKVYVRKPKSGFRKKLAGIMGVKPEEIDPHMKQKGEHICLPWDFLHGFIQKHLNDEKGLAVFALAIYGLVIFPKVLGHIEIAVIDFFEQVVNNVNPSPAILAETFRSLSYCRRKGEGRFMGCTQLLYIWIKSHFNCEVKEFSKPFYRGNTSIKEFCRSKWPKPKPKDEWVFVLQQLRDDQVTWMAPWMYHVPVLYRCGEESWIPLLGLWGVTSCAPLMVQRQFWAKQFTPATHGLNLMEYSYGEPKAMKKTEQAIRAWKQPRRFVTGPLSDKATPNYLMWRAKRVKDVVFVLRESLVYAQPEADISEIEIVRQQFKEEEKKMEQKNLKLQEEVENLKVKFEVQEAALKRMRTERDVAHNDLQELNQENKRLRREMRIGGIVMTSNERKKEIEDLRGKVEYWRNKAKKNEEGAAITLQEQRYWKQMYTVNTEKLMQCRKENEALKVGLKDEDYVKLQDERNLLQQKVQILEEHLRHYKNHIALIIQEWKLRENDWRYSYDLVVDASMKWRVRSFGRQQYIEHLATQVCKAVRKAREMVEKAEALRQEINPTGEFGQRLLDFLEEAKDQYQQVSQFYGYNRRMLAM